MPRSTLPRAAAWLGSCCLLVCSCSCQVTKLCTANAPLQVWRHVHPPERGVYWLLTQPMVHKGFLEAFTVDDLNVTIANKVQGIIAGGDGNGSGKLGTADDAAAAEGGSEGGGCRRWRVLCVGHSLGGALATLCAYDMARQAERLSTLGREVQVRAELGGRSCQHACLRSLKTPLCSVCCTYCIHCGSIPTIVRDPLLLVVLQVQLYTFGAPRPGNHAFARDFITVVPDRWGG